MEDRTPLPDNDAALANIARVPIHVWLDHAQVIRAFFRSKNGRLHQKRCDQELNMQDTKTRVMSEKAKKGAQIRWKKHNKNQHDTCQTHATALPSDCPEMLEERRGEEKEILKKESIKKKATRPTAVPDDFQPDDSGLRICHDNNLNPTICAQQFIDYWKGAGKTKADWQATFRNSVRGYPDMYRRQGAGTDGNCKNTRESATGFNALFIESFGLGDEFMGPDHTEQQPDEPGLGAQEILPPGFD